jgi:hypothetical protein
VYGFTQGPSGDLLEFENLSVDQLVFLPLIDLLNVPVGYVDHCIIRVFGKNLDNQINVNFSINTGGALSTLKLSEGNSALLVTANSQNTGENQSIYSLTNQSGQINTYLNSQIIGNYLDIDSWSADNFAIA